VSGTLQRKYWRKKWNWTWFFSRRRNSNNVDIDGRSGEEKGDEKKEGGEEVRR